MIKKILLLFLFILSFTNCKQNEFEDSLFRTRNDPFYDVPVTDSFTKCNTVYLNWNKDDACDEFYLMRTEDVNGISSSSWECIYQGNGLSYVDDDLSSTERFVYRLDKKRGEKLFKGEKFAFGVGADTCCDENEDNDTQEKAKLLDVDFTGNLPCVKYINDDEVHTDRDWFYIDLPARRQAQIQVHEASSVSKTDETSMYISQPTRNPKKIQQDYGIFLKNSENIPARMYFEIYPDSSIFSDSQEKYTVIEYTVSLIEINKYSE